MATPCNADVHTYNAGRVPSVAIQRILGGATPNLTIEHLSSGAFIASGFDVLPARVLLDFCDKHSINCKVHFVKNPHVHHKSFQVHFFYESPDDSSEPAILPAPALQMDSHGVDEKEQAKLKAIGILAPVHAHKAEIVTFPRVLQVRFFCKKGISASELDALLRGPSVRDVRLGGLGQAVEVIMRRASRFEHRAPKRIHTNPNRATMRACGTRKVRSMVKFSEEE